MYQLVAGLAYQFPHTPQENWTLNAATVGTPEVVDVPTHVAQRCRYLGEMKLIDGYSCLIFFHVDSGTRYAQVAP